MPGLDNSLLYELCKSIRPLPLSSLSLIEDDYHTKVEG